ncbi:MAG: hypothetical protein KIT22_04950 [Verrucomicrobiae bacterium]|nr:hypothetical protein [Verrucomicrobiae bacterium]
MSYSQRLVPLGAALLASLASASAATITLPASAALPPGSSSTRGFVVRAAQAPADVTIANNAIRAAKQINGILTDATGAAVPDEAFPGPEPGGAYALDTINFERDGVEVELYCSVY